MSPHFTSLMVKDLKDSYLPFYVHFNETTTTQVKKQMDVTVRYWSPTHGEVWVRFYTSLFFGHAEGDKVATTMYSRMLSDGIAVDKILTLIQDHRVTYCTLPFLHKSDRLYVHTVNIPIHLWRSCSR